MLHFFLNSFFIIISIFLQTEEDSSGAESVTKEKQKKTSKANKTTSKEPKGKSQGKGKALLKKTVAIEEPNSNEDDSDVVSIASIRSPYKKTSNEESEEDREPPKKKGRKIKVTESQVSTRGRKTANVSRTRKATRQKKVLHSDSDGEQPTSSAEIETGEQPSTSKKAESQVSTRGRKTANVSRPRKATRGRKVLHFDSDGEQPTSSAEIETVEQPSSSKTAQTATPSSNNTIDSLLDSPLGQIGLEQGGLTVVEDLGTPNQAPSFLVPPVLAETNPAFAQAQPGSLVLVSEPNPGDPDNQLVHVYRIAVPLQPVPM